MSTEQTIKPTLVESLMEAGWIVIAQRIYGIDQTVYMFELPNNTYVVVLIKGTNEVDYKNCYDNCPTLELAKKVFATYFPGELQHIMSSIVNSSNNYSNMNELYYIWYSQKMADGYGYCYARLENGTIAKYTVMASTNNHECKWDDIVFVGRGVFIGIGKRGRYTI